MSGNNEALRLPVVEPAGASKNAWNDDQATVASHGTHRSNRSNRSYGSSYKSRGYPTGGRRDDESTYSRNQRRRLDPRRRSSWKASCSRDRSVSDRHEGSTAGDHSRYQRSESIATSTSVGRDLKRGRSSSIPRSQSASRFENSVHRRRFESISKSRSPGRFLRPTSAITEWPPCFDNEGSAFVFHPASGMFYEEHSDFFYDPKAKLYYGVKKAAYFRYVDSEDPPFVETQRADPTQGTPMTPVEPPITLPTGNSPQAVAMALTVTPKIAIKLKTKKLNPKPKVVIDVLQQYTTDIFPRPAAVSKVLKDQVANMEKWKEKKAELQGLSSNTPICITAEVAAAEIKTTGKGEPICVICKRKFPTIEKLRVHENLSELHKSNVAKVAQQLELAGEKRKHDDDASTSTSTCTAAAGKEYHDRAEKRRHLHGPESANIILPVPIAGVNRETPDIPKGFDEQQHIGIKLLQKLGWQSGSKLGRQGGDGASENARSSHEEIRKDWDRIESLAGRAPPG